MRAARFVLAGILVSAAFSTSAPARPRIPGALLGAMVGTVGGIMALRHRHAHAARYHRSGASRVATAPATKPPSDTDEPANQVTNTPAPNAPARSAAVTPTQPVAAAPTRPASPTQPAAQSAWIGPLFWPRLADDLIDYVFWPSGGNDRFWAYGYGDIIEGALRPAGRIDTTATRRGRSTTAVASGAGVAPGPCAGQPAGQSADAVIARIEETIPSSETQKAIIAELRTATLRGLEYVETACPTDRPQTPTTRLDSMEDRLWAARQALLVMRAPIAKLYGSLTDEQKARLNGPVAGPVSGPVSATGAATQGGGRGCGQPADLPAARIEQRVRPSNEQRPGLEALRMTSTGLARLLTASCPFGTPATPVERLDTADRRLNSMLYAVVTLRAPLDGFYASLSDQQKTRFNASR